MLIAIVQECGERRECGGDALGGGQRRRHDVRGSDGARRRRSPRSTRRRVHTAPVRHVRAARARRATRRTVVVDIADDDDDDIDNIDIAVAACAGECDAAVGDGARAQSSATDVCRNVIGRAGRVALVSASTRVAYERSRCVGCVAYVLRCAMMTSVVVVQSC